MNEEAYYAKKEKELEELESIIKKVPYSLPVALIKMCQLNKYAPLGIEKYYELISPTFYLLRRTDGSKYQSNSIKTVRAAMLSEELFYKNDDGLYVLNISKALKHIKYMEKKKEISDSILSIKIEKKRAKQELKNKERLKKMLGKKKKQEEKEIIKEKAHKKKAGGRYKNAYKLFSHLLTITENNKNISSKLNTDLDEINTVFLNDDENNNNYIIGMLTVFKFFKPFLEKSFNSFRVQEKMIQKLAELNSEVRYLEALHKAQH